MKSHMRRKGVCWLVGWFLCAGLILLPAEEGMAKASDWDRLQPTTIELFDPRVGFEESRMALKEKESEVGVKSIELCPLLEDLGQYHMAFGDFKKAEERFLRGVEIARGDASPAGKETCLRLTTSLFGYYRAVYDHEKARKLADELQGLMSFDGPEETLSPHFKAFYSVIEYLRYDGRYEAAQDLYRRAFVALKERGCTAISWVRWDYGGALYLEGKFERAKLELGQALDEETAFYPEGSELVPRILVSLAATELALGNRREAVKLCKEALTAAEKAFGWGRFAHKNMARQVAIIYSRAGRPIEAEENFRLALSAYVVLGIVPFQTETIYRAASFYAGLGRFEDAATLLEKLLETNIPVLGENHYLIAYLKTALGVVWRDWGIMEGKRSRLGKAEEYLLEGRWILEQWPFAGTWECVSIYRESARLYLAKGEYAGAEELLTRCVEIVARDRGERCPILYWIYRDLAQCYRSMGEKEEAERFEVKMKSLPMLPETVFFF